MIRRRSTRRIRLRPTVDRLEGRALMAYAGSGDPSFGLGGYTSISVSPTANSGLAVVSSVAVESDGSILEAGVAGLSNQTTFGVIHLTASGAVDAAFGVNGEADVALPAGAIAQANNFAYPQPLSLLVRPDGSFALAAGFYPSGSFSIDDTVVASFHANGTADDAFGTGGVTVLGPAGVAVGGATYSVAALQGDGKIVLAGTASNPQSTNGSRAVALARLGTTGQLDAGYGTNGLATVYNATQAQITGAGLTFEFADAVAIDLFGRAVVTATSNSNVGVGEIFRVQANGTRDASVSQSGLQATGATRLNPQGLLIQPDGKILVTGLDVATSGTTITGIRSIVARLNSDGTIDAIAALPPGVNLNQQGGIGLEPDGGVVLTQDGPAAFKVGYRGTTVGVARLRPNLTRDATFGRGGVSTLNLPVLPPPTKDGFNQFFAANTVAITKAGQVILAGVVDTTLTNIGILPRTNVVARLTPTGSAHPGDLTGDGVADPAVYVPASGSFVILDSTTNAVQSIPFGAPGAGNSIPTIGDYTGSGRKEIGVYLPTLAKYAYRPPTGPDVVISFGTAGAGQTIPVPADYYRTGQDDVAVYLAASASFAILAPDGKSGIVVPFGQPGVGNSIPVPGDYDGSGHVELAVYVPSIAAFFYRPANGGPDVMVPFGTPGAGNSLPAPGDYTNLGHDEFAVYLPASGTFAFRVPGQGDAIAPFGSAGVGASFPAPGDYNGSGYDDLGVYLPNLGALAYRPPIGPDVVDFLGTKGPGATIPVTRTILSPFPGSGGGGGGGGSAHAMAIANVAGGFAPLDFIATPGKKAKGGGAIA